MSNEQPQQVELPRMQDIQATGNPFEMQQYKGVQLPDTPISYGGGLADSMLNDNEVPEEIRTKFWHVFHKDNTLSFLDEDRKRTKMLSFDIFKIDELNSIPYYDYNFEKELELNVLRNVFETKLDRALGIKGNVKNERIILQSQFTEMRNIQENSSSKIQDNFFKKLFARR